MLFVLLKVDGRHAVDRPLRGIENLSGIVHEMPALEGARRLVCTGLDRRVVSPLRYCRRCCGDEGERHRPAPPLQPTGPIPAATVEAPAHRYTWLGTSPGCEMPEKQRPAHCPRPPGARHTPRWADPASR